MGCGSSRGWSTGAPRWPSISRLWSLAVPENANYEFTHILPVERAKPQTLNPEQGYAFIELIGQIVKNWTLFTDLQRWNHEAYSL